MQPRWACPFLLLPAARLRRHGAARRACSSARSIAASTREPHLDQVLFSIGLVFMAVAAIDYFVGSMQQIVTAAGVAAGAASRSRRRRASASIGSSSSCVCGAADARRCRLVLLAHALRQPPARRGRRSARRARAWASTSTAIFLADVRLRLGPGRARRRARRRDPRPRSDVSAQVHDLFPDRRLRRRHDHDHRAAARLAAARHRRRRRQVLRAQARRLHHLHADDRDPAACARRACSRAAGGR